MTTPQERRRNLIWGRETLEELAIDSTLPEGWQDSAAELLAHYPSFAALRHCDDEGLETLQVRHAQVLFGSRELFQRMRVSQACSKQRKYSLLVILRHFY